MRKVERRSRPVSRILYRSCLGGGPEPLARGPAAAISLSPSRRAPATSRYLGRRSCGRPGSFGRATLGAPCLALLRVGLAEPDRSPGPLVGSYLTVSPLPPRSGGGLLSVALSARLPPPGRYPAPCPSESGLSSSSRPRPPGRLLRIDATAQPGPAPVRWALRCAGSLPRSS